MANNRVFRISNVKYDGFIYNAEENVKLGFKWYQTLCIHYLLFLHIILIHQFLRSLALYMHDISNATNGLPPEYNIIILDPQHTFKSTSCSISAV